MKSVEKCIEYRNVLIISCSNSSYSSNSSISSMQIRCVYYTMHIVQKFILC